MKNIENNLEKLTGMEGKSYHGNMTENGDKLPEKTPFEKERIDKATKSQIFESKASGQAKDAQEEAKEQKSKISAEQEAASRNKAEAGERARREEQLRREHAEMIKRIMLKNEGGEEEKGILGLLLDILISALTGTGEKIDEVELGKKMEKSEAMQAVRAYMRIRPKNLWKGEDYARVVFMLKPDESREANILKKTFRDEVKGETEDVYSNKLIELDRGGLERLKGGGSKNIDEEIIDRRIQAHADLREEMKASGELSKLSTGKINALAIEAGGISGGSGKKNTSGGNEEADKEGKGGQDRGGDEKKGVSNEKKEKKVKGRLDKAIELFLKDFSPEEQQRIIAWVESGDPDGFKKARGLYEKYKGDPKVLEEGAEAFLEVNELSEEPSENVKKVAGLARDIQSKLGAEEPRTAGESRLDEEEMRLDEEKRDKAGDNKAKEEKIKNPKEIVNEVYKKRAQEEWKKYEIDLLGRIDTRLGNLEEQGEIGIGQRKEGLYKATQMVDQLRLLNERIDKLTGAIIAGFSGDADALKKDRDEYAKLHAQRFAMDSELNQMADVERAVLGGEMNKELYDGTVGEGLEERMNRIEYFIVRSHYSKDEGIDFEKLERDISLGKADASLKSILDLNPNASGVSVEERKQKEAFLERMQKVYAKFEKEGTISMKKSVYFQELQRWAGEIMGNSQWDISERRHDLDLPKKIYDELKEIMETGAHVYDYKSPEEFEDSILKKVNELRRLGIADYFKDTSYIDKSGRYDELHYPATLEATCLLIADAWPGEKWATGEEFELIDATGKFHPENFRMWMIHRIWRLSDRDSVKAINPLQDPAIAFKAGFGQLTLSDLFQIDKYSSVRDLEIVGKVSDDGSVRSESKWGRTREHPDMTYDIRESMMIEVWRRGFIQGDWAVFHLPQVRAELGEWLKGQNQIATEGNMLRDWHFWQDFKLPSHKEREFHKYYNEDEQGSVGAAIRAGQLWMRHLTEWTEYYTDRDDDWKVTGVKGFEKNRAYKTLGYTGSSGFLLSLAENGLGWADPKAGNDIREFYREFILDMTDKMGKSYKVRVDDDKKVMIDNLVDNFEKKIKKQHDMKISFDRFDDLVDLKLKIETVVLEKTLVKESEKREYGLKEDKVVVKEELEREVKGLMGENLRIRADGKDFLSRVMNIEIPVVLEKDNGDKKRIEGAGERSKIKDIEVFVTADERIVTKEEWEQIGGGSKMSLGKIIKDFGDNFAQNENTLWTIKSYVGARKEYKEAVKAEKKAEQEYEYERGRHAGDPEKRTQIEKARIELERKRSDLRRMEDEYNNCKQVYEDNKGAGVYEDILRRQERMGLAMVTKVANVSRKGINIFNATKSEEEVQGNTTRGELLKEALKKGLTRMYDLNDYEARYAYEGVWYVLPQTRITSWNNTSGVLGGIDPGTALLRTKRARLAQQGLSTTGGSNETIDEYLALSSTLYDSIPVKRSGEGVARNTILGIMQGSEPGREDEMKDWFEIELGDTKTYLIKKDAQMAEYVDHLQSGVALWKLLVEEEPELSFHEVVYTDQWGAQRMDRAKTRKLIDAWWNRHRLAYNSSEIYYDRKTPVDGRSPTERERMFGKDTRETMKIMQEYYREQAGNRKLEKHAKEYYVEMADKIMIEPAIAALMNNVAAAIHEHRDMYGIHEQWDARTIKEIWWVLDNYLHEKYPSDKLSGNDPIKGKDNPSMIPYELFNRIRGVHKSHSWLFGETEDSMEKDTFRDFFFAFVAGFLEGVTGTWVEFKDELALIQKTPPLSA